MAGSKKGDSIIARVHFYISGLHFHRQERESREVETPRMEDSLRRPTLSLHESIFISVASISIEKKETVESPRMEEIPLRTTLSL
jgi:hypothetical protein